MKTTNDIMAPKNRNDGVMGQKLFGNSFDLKFESNRFDMRMHDQLKLLTINF